jgi:hypothetical protein
MTGKGVRSSNQHRLKTTLQLMMWKLFREMITVREGCGGDLAPCSPIVERLAGLNILKA